MDDGAKIIIVAIICLTIVMCCALWASDSKASVYTVPKASEQPRGRTYMYCRTRTITDASGQRLTVREYTATNGRRYLG